MVNRNLYLRLITIGLLSLFYSNSSAQSYFSNNPFLSEPNFFVSQLESNCIKALLNNKPVSVLELMLAQNNKTGKYKILNYQQKIDSIAIYLVNRKSKNNIRFLSKIFQYTHLEYLKKFQAYSEFHKLFDNKVYDCVTGTALYAMILDKMGINYQIYENTNHTYLIANYSNINVLFESTNPLNGFIEHPDSIIKLQLEYAQTISSDFEPLLGFIKKPNQSSEKYQYFQEKISLIQLAGLYYYNQAVIQYNLSNLAKAVNTLEKALIIYPSKRILSLLLLSIQRLTNNNEISLKELKILKAKKNYYTKFGFDCFN